MKIVIIEGLDNVGKDTIINSISIMFINQTLIAIYIRHNPNANKLTIKVDINDAKKYDIAKVFLSVGVIIKSLRLPFTLS